MELTRRSLFSALAAPALALPAVADPFPTDEELFRQAELVMEKRRFANRKRYFGRFDYRASGGGLFDPIELLSEARGGIVLLNGQQVKRVLAANTKTGILRTFDVLRDGALHLTENRWEWEHKDRYEAIRDGTLEQWPGGVEGLRTVVADTSSQQQKGAWREFVPTGMEPNGFLGRWIPVESYTAHDFPGRDVECNPDDVLIETLHGEVEIWGPEL